MISDDNASDNDGDNIENDSNKNDNSDEWLRAHDAQGGDVSLASDCRVGEFLSVLLGYNTGLL